jgi:N-acetylmuramoyl-L-alanine amidase
MWRILMWRPLSFVTPSLAGAALALLIHSPQAQGFQGLAISQVQPSSAPVPQQNTPLSTNTLQGPPSAPPEEAPGITVVLDPAHGGADFGARGNTGLAESDVVLDFARAARIALEAQRLRVLLTREGNQDPGFDSRSAMVNGLRNAVFVSLHVSSSGPEGTARTYYYVFPSEVTPGLNPAAGATPAQTTSPQISAPQAAARANLIEWDHAQRPSVALSRQLAGLAQTELAQRFKGSPEMPIAAPVRQLRTIAAPAIAIELSSIEVTDAKRLDQMAQPLAEAIGRAVAEFHYPVKIPAAATGGGH